MEFDSSYTSYWKNRVGSAIDGTKVADEEILQTFLPIVNIQPEDKVLDIGCSYGRFYNTLAAKGSKVYGLDIDPSAIKDCQGIGYVDLKVCPMETMAFQDNYFNKILCWGTFDCVDQETALLETSRILKPNGRVLITGKNTAYNVNDTAAFIAERNAKLKDFPNHFTDVKALVELLPLLGFKLIALKTFTFRGDFGLNKAVDSLDTLPDAFYEYLLVIEKVENTNLQGFKICSLYSHAAQQKAAEAGYNDVYSFFEEHKKNAND